MSFIDLNDARVRMKVAVLAEGIRISASARAFLFESGSQRAKRALRTRSGVSGGLDLDLGGGIFVNAPVNEVFAIAAPTLLDIADKQTLVLRRGRTEVPVDAVPEPAYYEMSSRKADVPLMNIGQMCSPDRFCYGMTGPSCSFWPSSKRCKYCSIGQNYNDDARRKAESSYIEALEAAVNDEILPARHVLIGGGTPPGDDMGASLAAELTQVTKMHSTVDVYVMIAAPLEDRWIHHLKDSGVDELGMNLEFWSDEAWSAYIPGKQARIGKERYLSALELAAGLFGPVKTRSIVIAGLEPLEATLHAVKELVARGVMPIISPFRPLDGTLLAARRGAAIDDYLRLMGDALDVCADAGLPLGPACNPCQNNTLALPV